LDEACLLAAEAGAALLLATDAGFDAAIDGGFDAFECRDYGTTFGLTG
jgi:hypothetical protein